MERGNIDWELIMKDSFRTKGLVLAILFSIQSVMTLVTGDLMSAVMPILICVGTWLAAFGKPAGAGIVHVIMVIYRVLMYILLGVVAVLFGLVFYGMFRLGSFDGVMGLFIGTAVAAGVIWFFVKMYANASLIAADAKMRLGNNNTGGHILVVDEITLSGFLVTIIVFQSLGLLMTIAAQTGVVGMIIGFVSEIISGAARSIGGYGGTILSGIIDGIFGNGLMKIIEGALNIAVTACSLVFINQYKRVIIR